MCILKRLRKLSLKIQNIFLSSKQALNKGDLAKAKEYIDCCLLNKHFDKEVLALGLQIANTLKINKDKIYILEKLAFAPRS